MTLPCVQCCVHARWPGAWGDWRVAHGHWRHGLAQRPRDASRGRDEATRARAFVGRALEAPVMHVHNETERAPLSAGRSRTRALR
eukprot:1008868-Pleurochrysis_carterae.AAC.3